MSKMTPQEREKFLAATRYGYFSTNASDGYPRTVPVWFEWDGEMVRLFTFSGSAKVKRIKQNRQVSLLVGNHLDEHEAWVAFDGTAEIKAEGGYQLAEKLAEEYWDLSDPDRKAELESWKQAAEHLCVIELVPKRIRSYVD
jgi:PPOX class probable F420-dependent enzyme